jgi:hypothetical protein
MATYRLFTSCAGTIAVVACAGFCVRLATGQMYSDEAAGGPPSSPKPAASPAPSGLNDMLQPLSPLPVTPRTPARQPDPAGDALPSRLSLGDRLRAWDDSTRQNARLQVELPSGVHEQMRGAARQIEAAWDAGDYGAAIAQLDWLESSGTPVALGVNWRTPRPGIGLRDFTDVRIGTRTGGASTALDYDAASKKLFAVVRWDSDNCWGLHMSTTGGNSWAETYSWYAGAGQHALSVDMVVVSGYVYVAYVPSDYANEGRLRRNLVSTGGTDSLFGYNTVLDAAPNTITEVKLTSDQDSASSRLYYAHRESNNAVRYAWDLSADGASFTEASPSGISAVGGLDLCWNPGYATYFAWLSYIGTDSRVHVLRRRAGAWEEATNVPFDGSHNRTAISAWDDHIICAHELQMTNGQGIRYFITHDGGTTWDYYNYIAEPQAGEGPYQMADVTARGGEGTAIVFTHETGEPDDVLIRYRRDYAPGVWQRALRVNNNDVSTGTWTSINWTPRDTTSNNELSYGLIYFYGSTPYYNRSQRLTGDMNCDGIVDFRDINPFVLGLSDPSGYAAVFPDCDIRNGDCNGDAAVDFKDINPFVAILAGGAP